MRSKDEVNARVLRAVEVHQSMAGQGATATEIARATGYKPSAWLRGVLWRLWADGKLDKVERLHWSGNIVKTLWTIREGK